MTRRLDSLRAATLLAGLSFALGACSETGPDGGADAPSVLPAGSGAADDRAGGTPAVQTDPGTDTAPGASPPGVSTIAPGGEFVSDVAAVRLRLPDGITATFDADGGTLAFADRGNALGGFAFGGAAGGVAAGASRAVRTLLPLLGVEISRVFEDRVNPDGSVSSRFGAVGGGGGTGDEIFMQLEVRQGAAGNYVAVLGNSAMDEASALGAIATELADGAAFGDPPPPVGLVELGGLVLEASSSGTESFGSGIGSGSLTGGDESFLVTCRDGRYRFSSTSSTYLNFGDGASGGSSESLTHEGLFTSYEDFGDNQLISLQSTDRGTFVLNVTLSNGVLLLDRTAYVQTGTSEAQCGG